MLLHRPFGCLAAIYSEVDLDARQVQFLHHIAQLLSRGDVRDVQLLDADILEVQQGQAAREQLAEDTTRSEKPEATRKPMRWDSISIARCIFSLLTMR